MSNLNNFKDYTARIKLYWKFLGIELNVQESWQMRIYKWANFFNGLAMGIFLLLHLFFGAATVNERYNDIMLFNYYYLGLGKELIAIFLHTKFVDAFQKLEKISPDSKTVHCYKLEAYLTIYKSIEKFIHNFFKYLVALYQFQPLIESLIGLWKTGDFGFLVPLPVWPIFYGNALGYVVCYAMSSFAICPIGIGVLAIDLCLMSFISQLCVQFDLLAQRIVELKPERQESLNQLKQIVKEHQTILKLKDEFEAIFAPSIFFSLSSSSFIICFVAYQMLDDISLFEVFKAFLLLCYELKQITLICYFANKLVDTSAKIFDALWEHEWYKGSLAYRRFLVFLLMKTRRTVGFRVGTTMVGLEVLRQVFGNSYQIFAVLKSG